jgi:hypothetical protein
MHISSMQILSLLPHLKGNSSRDIGNNMARHREIELPHERNTAKYTATVILPSFISEVF